MRNLIATGGVILVALATGGGALAQGEALAPITPEQCRFIESYVGTATAGLHRQVEAANQLADSLKRLAPTFVGRPSLTGDVGRVIVTMEASRAAMVEMLAAFEDFQHGLRICARSPQ